MSEPSIRVEAVSKRFGRMLAVDNISFTVPACAITGILGPNGAGKTTTLAMILGLLTPTSGQITVLGVEMTRHRHQALARMNFASPYVELPARLTVRENLRVYADLYDVAKPWRRIGVLCEDLELVGVLDKATRKLSAGQKTRLAVAKALINEPEVLLLDEPTASLDPSTADLLRSYLEGYQRRRHATLLLASHNMAEVERMCSQVLMMKAGRVVHRGAPEDLRAHYGKSTLEEVFIDITRTRTRAVA